MLDNKEINEKEEETSVASLENKDDKQTDPNQTDEDTKGKEDKPESEDVEKQEDEEKQKEDPYEKKLAELEKDGKQKSTALIEKNKKIKDLKKDLEDKSEGLSKEEVREMISSALEGSKVEKSEMDGIMEVAKENNINVAISQHTDDSRKVKIIRHFFDNKVNKELSFNEQVNQAVILANNVLENPEFKAEVEKAGQSNVQTNGQQSDDLSIPANLVPFAKAIFKTKEGQKQFAKNLQSN